MSMKCKINGFLNDFKTYRVILFIFLLNILACSQEEKATSVAIIRFENEFYNSNERSLPELMNKYPFFFPKKYSISIWNQFLKDSVKLEIFKETQKIFQNFDSIANEIELIFNNSKSLFPKFLSPKVFTLNSQSEYSNRIIYADSLMFISLDSYLGKDYYPELPSYISQKMSKEFLSTDLAISIASSYIIKESNRTLLSEMIYHGKILFISRLLFPESKNYILFHSSEDKIQWADTNEKKIWTFFTENEYLFNTSQDLSLRFISLAPYSKFNLDIDKDSPGSIGKWIGFNIVNSYMKNNKVSVEELITMNNYEIFKKSKYKPKKQ
jgi:hypothetical protein